ncbi:MAG: hypothetical protein RKE49_11855 [Oceanicaulis sp.]
MTQVINETFGSAKLRGVKRGDAYVGQVFTETGRSAQINAESVDALRGKLKAEAARLSRGYVGFEGARTRFLDFMPAGFADARYVAQKRDYKLARRATLEAAAPLSARPFTAEQAGAAAKAFSINLLHSTEQIRAREALVSPSGPAVLEALAAFTETPDQVALDALARLLKPFEAARWTVITLLPFFWRPDRHMFLKPEVTCEFALAVGHPFHLEYAADLHIAVYDSLMNLTARTECELASLRPVDRLDVQGFIWVVGRYVAEDVGPSSKLEGEI